MLNLLESRIDYIFLDETDDSLDYGYRSKFIKLLEDIKELKNSDAHIVMVTHCAETLFNLPQNYKILKIINKKEIKEYYSQDFTSKTQLEKVIFNKGNRNIYISEEMKSLIQFYKNILGEKSENFNSIKMEVENSFEYNKLSIKEKIIYNSILKF